VIGDVGSSPASRVIVVNWTGSAGAP